MLLPKELLGNDGFAWPKLGDTSIDLEWIDQRILMSFE